MNCSCMSAIKSSGRSHGNAPPSCAEMSDGVQFHWTEDHIVLLLLLFSFLSDCDLDVIPATLSKVIKIDTHESGEAN